MASALVVDDSAVVRKVARRLLEEKGFAVAEAEDAAGAMAECQKRAPDLLLLDWLLADPPLPEWTRQVRALLGQGPRIVAMMDEADLGQVTLALRSGASDVMLKPFDRDSFTSQLDLG